MLPSWEVVFGDNWKVVPHRRLLFTVLASFILLMNDFAVLPAAAQTSSKSPVTRSRSSATTRRKKISPRVRRMRQAFVASASLKPMAQQLLQDRTPAAYAGVEAYARRHNKEDAGALAWLVLGYAHVLDRDYAKAIDPLNRAKPRGGDLGDYIAFYLGTAYLQTGRTAEAVAALTDFEKNNPDSLLIRDARVSYANALIADNRAADAVTLLESDRQPTRADVELALGRAYAASGATSKAAATLRNLYLTMPLSPEADAASVQLKTLSPAPPLPAPGIAERRSRADLLLKGRRFLDAANEYHDLLDVVAPADRPTVQLAYATALRRAGKDKDARKSLESLAGLSGEANAERLYNLGEISRNLNDDDGFLRTVEQLRQGTPSSSWFEQSLLSYGNFFLLRRDYDHAIDAYRELQQRFPTGSRASYAHWKAAWLTLRQGRNQDAREAFEQQIALYPNSAEIPAALYWRGRLAEEESEPAKARAFYLKVSDRFKNYYYGELARQRLKILKSTTVLVQYAILDRVPPIAANAKVVAGAPPADNLRVQKAQLLENGGLLDFAIRELRAAAEQEKGNWLAPESAGLYQNSGRYDMAIETMKREVPNYFALDLSSLPRSYWEALFPKPFWADLKRFSARNQLDPFLVASLIRQESEFNPNAVSRANAVGLMQLLPKTGRTVAKKEKLHHFNASQLYLPGINLQLGTSYFRSMVDQFGGSFEYALAAYNAGSDRVDEWLGQAKYRDPQEFVESIPFTETREYVQAILRNTNVYRQLYGTP
jgi:soluble lytic murein transglycosylase